MAYASAYLILHSFSDFFLLLSLGIGFWFLHNTLPILWYFHSPSWRFLKTLLPLFSLLTLPTFHFPSIMSVCIRLPPLMQRCWVYRVTSSLTLHLLWRPMGLCLFSSYPIGIRSFFFLFSFAYFDFISSHSCTWLIMTISWSFVHLRNYLLLILPTFLAFLSRQLVVTFISSALLRFLSNCVFGPPLILCLIISCILVEIQWLSLVMF